uniref:Uncharacterized protein n=1 Tax=Biomphalaria glabrata TaxID=6526 RepID=A0A2C9KBM1_BIOGL
MPASHLGAKPPPRPLQFGLRLRSLSFHLHHEEKHRKSMKENQKKSAVYNSSQAKNLPSLNKGEKVPKWLCGILCALDICLEVSIVLETHLTKNCLSYCNPVGTVPNANCTIEDHRMICKCQKGYFGDRCTETCNFCASKPCYNGGHCSSNGSDVTCACPIGQNCTFMKDPLLSYTSDEQFVTPDIVNNILECEQQCLNENWCLAYSYAEVQGSKICAKYHQLYYSNNSHPYQTYLKKCSQYKLFNGEYCQEDIINNCNTEENICSQLDFCMDLINSTQCVCPIDGDYDANCTKQERICDSHSCVHGTCENLGTLHHVCICEPGYTGQNCSVNIDDCALNPHGCLHNGICQDQVNTYNCSCKSGFDGDHCQVLPDLCNGNSCQEADGGICVEDYQNLNHRCVCGENYNQTYIGNNTVCTKKDFCYPTPCKNGGTCQSNAGSFSCQCTDGFEGSLCQIEIKAEKNETTCESIDVCQSAMKEYFCHWCSSSNDSCLNESCVHTCRSFNNLTAEERILCQCFCNETTIDDICLLNDPCLHGGKCTNTSSGYSCSCNIGWTGEDCEIPVDYCSQNNTCKNNAGCYNLANDTYCHCPSGTGGKTCELKKELCENYGNFTCRHGSCEPDGGSAQCKCQDSYTGKSCELLTNLCSADPCYGGKCYLNESSFYCDCREGQQGASSTYCNSTVDPCSKCPPSSNCTTYIDDNGLQQAACLCPPDKILSGNECTKVNKDFDLVFVKDFAIKKQWITSLRGFSLENVTSLTLTMWLAAAKSLNDSDVILSLTSSEKENFLSLLNSKVRLNSTEIAFHCLHTHCTLDADNIWHFIAVTWSQNGSLVLYFDAFNYSTAAETFNSIRYASIQLGQGFSGYISNVQLWKSAITAEEISQLYEDENYVPQPENLLLDWTYYSFDEKVFMSKTSLAKKNTSICVNITLSALFPLEDICHGYNDDKEPPLVQQSCLPMKVIAVDYTQHQIGSGQLGYSFTDKDNNFQSTKVQYFSHGAYDIAVAANDSSGNIGVCMTRTFITPNKCEDTKPANYTESCNHSTGVVVVCPDGYLPSEQTPKVLACGQLKTYNLDNMYELPDRIVCGKTANPSNIQNGNYPCPDGKTLRDNLCVECGRGSYYKNQTRTCELCALNSYSNESGKTECIQCPASHGTLQRGSSSLSDCVGKFTDHVDQIV